MCIYLLTKSEVLGTWNRTWIPGFPEPLIPLKNLNLTQCPYCFPEISSVYLL